MSQIQRNQCFQPQVKIVWQDLTDDEIHELRSKASYTSEDELRILRSVFNTLNDIEKKSPQNKYSKFSQTDLNFAKQHSDSQRKKKLRRSKTTQLESRTMSDDENELNTLYNRCLENHIVPPACDDTIFPLIKRLNLIEMPSSSLIYDDQEQHLESIQTCQRNDNCIGAGPCRRHSCERIRSPASYGFPTSIRSPDLTSGLVYFKDSFDGDGPLKEWVIPSKPDKPQGKFVVATKK
ncbi:hypothetical protein GJ496_004940 [Pomphorhynchus laevis]|nr:hypothetical protein GJ496_004940 [Pomphorhynchus laevis]